MVLDYYFRLLFLCISPLILLLVACWIWSSVVVKEVFWQKETGFLVEHKKKMIPVSFQEIQALYQFKRPSGMPIKVTLKEEKDFGKVFYFVLKLRWYLQLSDYLKNNSKEIILDGFEKELEKA